MPFEDESIPGWDQLPRVYQKYLKGLSEGPAYLDTEDAVRQVELLLSPKETLQKIDDLVEQLKSYEVAPGRAINERVRGGWKALENFLERNEAILKKHNVALFITGSMIYNDPKHLDLDGLFVTESRNDWFKAEFEGKLSRDLERAFRIEIAGEGSEVLYTNFSILDNYCWKIRDEDEKFVLENGQSIKAELANASQILNGYPIYGSSERVDSMRGKVRILMSENPLLATEICMTLEETLRIREERRG